LKEIYLYFVDINHDIVGNRNLLAETSHNFLFSPSYNLEKKEYNISASLNIFYNKIKNLITLAQINATQYSYVNIGEYATKGADINLKLKYGQIKITSGFQLTGIYDGGFDVQQKTWFYTPQITASFNYTFIKYDLSTGVYYAGYGKENYYILGEDNAMTAGYRNPYHLADIIVMKDFWKNKIQLSAGCKNVFDVKYISSYGTLTTHSTQSNSLPVNTGRSYFLKLMLTLNFNNEKKMHF
jgi:outer membrane receptor for ferrienterochelin and colicins